jgi:hypothetical protein
MARILNRHDEHYSPGRHRCGKTRPSTHGEVIIISPVDFFAARPLSTANVKHFRGAS